MNSASTLEAARILLNHWQSGSTLDNLPEQCRPQSRADGYAIQTQIAKISGREIVGWKIAATSKAGQNHINVSGPMAGQMLSDQIFPAGSTIPAAGNRMRVAETEMAFVMGKDLFPRNTPYEMAEVMEAVQSLHTAIEIPNSRFAAFTAAGEAQLLADSACAHHFMLGAKAPDPWRKLDLSQHKVQALIKKENGQMWSREGIGSAVLGDPRLALTWLVNELSSQGLILKSGQFVTTGTCMTPLEIEPGDRVEADFGELGKISMAFGH